MNARNEFTHKLTTYKKDISDIAYMAIYCEHRDFDNDNDSATYTYVYKDGDEFDMEALNFDYDSGFGTQELYGTIVFKDGSWFEREEYDGSEHWRFISGTPSIEAVMAIIPKKEDFTAYERFFEPDGGDTISSLI